jgi:hypothetical protein
MPAFRPLFHQVANRESRCNGSPRFEPVKIEGPVFVCLSPTEFEKRVALMIPELFIWSDNSVDNSGNFILETDWQSKIVDVCSQNAWGIFHPPQCQCQDVKTTPRNVVSETVHGNDDDDDDDDDDRHETWFRSSQSLGRTIKATCMNCKNWMAEWPNEFLGNSHTEMFCGIA